MSANIRFTSASGGGGAGDVTGPSSSRDNAIARYDGETGKIIQGSKTYITDRQYQIHGNFGHGYRENLLLRSEAFNNNAAWVRTGFANSAANDTVNPYSEEINADTLITNTAGSNTIIQTVVGETTASKSFTFSAWFDCSVDFNITIESSNEQSSALVVNTGGAGLKWHTLTHTFTGGSTGDVRVQIERTGSGDTITCWGGNLSNTAYPVAYSQTHKDQEVFTGGMGGYLRGNLLVYGHDTDNGITITPRYVQTTPAIKVNWDPTTSFSELNVVDVSITSPTFGVFNGFYFNNNGTGLATCYGAKLTGNIITGVKVEGTTTTLNAFEAESATMGAASSFLKGVCTSSGISVSNSFIDIRAENAANQGKFLQFRNSEGQGFIIDNGLNVIVTTGYMILPRCGIGATENLLKFSEQISNAAWVKTSVTATANSGPSPGGEANVATKIDWGASGGGNLKQLRTDINTLANRTFTLSGWARRAPGSSTNSFALGIRTSAGKTAGFGRVYSVGETPDGQYVLLQYTGTFDGTPGAGETLEVRITGSTNLELEFWGMQLVEGSKLRAYSPTDSMTRDTPHYGTFVNGHLEVAGGKDVAHVEIREGPSQGSTPPFNVQNNAGTTQFSIDSGFDVNIVDHDIILGVSTGTKIGTSANQKIGIWSATPIVRPNSTGETTGYASVGGSAVSSSDTFTGNVGTKAYTINDIVKHLKNIGLIASA